MRMFVCLILDLFNLFPFAKSWQTIQEKLDAALTSFKLVVFVSMFSTTKQILFYCVVTSTNKTSQCPSNSVENDTLSSLVLNRRFSSFHSVLFVLWSYKQSQLVHPLIVESVMSPILCYSLRCDNMFVCRECTCVLTEK